MNGDLLVRGSRVNARLLRPESLDAGRRAALYGLLAESFSGTTPERFEHDLDEKDSVLLLEERETGRPVGFSTQKRMEATVDGAPVVALFSGDTVVEHSYWGETALARGWARMAFGVAAAAQPARVFWFLICSGYKTYRFLPLFFQNFYPRRGVDMPAETRRILKTFASARYPREYDDAHGVVRLSEPAPLRCGVADVTPRRLEDPDVAFFVRANPGHGAGDELACLAEITRHNLTPAALRAMRE